MDENKKNCFEVLSTEDIRKLASNWTLANDVGLLAHLEQFSEKICSQAQITQNNFNKLLHDYEELHSTIDNITNQFLALQNCQFVENRVYDEETPVEERTQEKVINKDEKEKFLLMQYKKAVEIGIKLLDTHFQEIHLPPSSDSEEEESVIGNSSLIWRPKNPYIGKKFPVLIGSAEWWSDDSVGLGGCEKIFDKEEVFFGSESEEESMQEIEKKMSSSSSSTENEKNISDNLGALDSSGMYMFGLGKNESFHKNSVEKFEDSGNTFIGKPKELKNSVDYEDEIVQKINSNNEILEGNENMTEQNVKITEKVNLPFTQELAAKLQSVLESNDFGKSENETLEYNKNEEKNFICKDLFDEQEDDCDLFSEKKTNSSDKNNLLFNNEKNDQLFDDSNNLLFESKTNMFDCDSATKNKTDLFSNSVSQEFLDDFKSSIKKKSTISDENLSKSLFADLDDDEILFNSYPINVSQSLSESLNSRSNDKLEKVGSVISDGGSKHKIGSLSKNDFDDDLFTEPTTIFTPQIKAKTNLKNMEHLISNTTTYSLDEETSDLFREVTDRAVKTKEYNEKENLNTSKKPEFPNSILVTKNISDCSSLKEKSSNEGKSDNKNFASNVEKDFDIVNTKEDSFFGKKTTLLNKLACALEDDDISLFLEKTSKPDALSVSSSRSSLFDDVSASKSRLSSVFERDKCSKLVNELFSETSDSLFDDDLFIEKNDNTSIKVVPLNKVTKVARNSLFDDYEDTDTLFGSSSQNNSLFGNYVLGNEKDLEKNSVIGHHFSDENSQNKNSVKESILFSKSKVDSLKAQTNNEAHNFLRTTEPLNESEYLIDGSKEKKTELFNNDNNVNSVKENSTSVYNQDIFINKVENPELFSREHLVENARVKLKPPNSLKLKKDSDLPTDPLRGKSYRKLNISDDLKAKFESTVKPCFLDSKGEREIVDRVGNQKKDSDIIFDKSFQTESNLLKCPSKDRVKIPVKRRPQSRRARQEAIRNSETNFLANAHEESGTTETSLLGSNSNESLFLKKESLKNNSKFKFPPPALSNPLSPSTDEEDYFNVPELDTYFEKEDQRIFKSNLFESESISNNDDSLLFNATPILSPLMPKNQSLSVNKAIDDDFLFKSSETKVKSKKNNIFRDDDDDDDDVDKCSEDDDFSLFRSDNTIQEKTYSGFTTQKFKAFSGISNLKKPLFDVSPNSEDLFGEKLSVTIANLPNENNAKEAEKNINITEKNNQQFVDPLGIMFNEKK